MLQAILGFIPQLLTLGGKMIVDKDKQAEYAFNVQKMFQDLALKLLDTKTYPWVDALVKLAFAADQIIKGLFRPLGSAALFAYAVYCDTHGIPLSDTVKTLMYSAFPAWGVSRHVEKSADKKIAQTKAEKPYDPMNMFGD